MGDTRSSCRRCGKHVLFGQTADGKLVLLDPAVAVYAVFDGKALNQVTRTTLSMADHLALCQGTRGKSEVRTNEHSSAVRSAQLET